MKSFALVGSLIAILIITFLLWQSIESVAPSATPSSSSAPTQETLISLPANAADVAAEANARVEEVAKAMKDSM